MISKDKEAELTKPMLIRKHKKISFLLIPGISMVDNFYTGIITP